MLQHSSDVGAKLKALAETVRTIWGNQSELSTHLTQLDGQFAVLVRMTIGTLNEVIDRYNAAVDDEERGPMASITFERVEELFKQYNEFTNRPDFRAKFREWAMAMDISKIPVEEQAKEKDEDSQEEALVREFGGDYENTAESEDGNGKSVADSSREAASQVPV